jgi:hypothetical protein
MEEEVRTILRRSVLADEGPPSPLGSRIRAQFEGIGLERSILALRGGKPRAPKFK